MKRKQLILAIALLLVVGAALWGVNYRLDHPPLTQADKEFRALVAGADSIEASQQIVDSPIISLIPLKVLNSETRELLENMRFVKVESLIGLPKYGVDLDLEFRSKGKTQHCTLSQLSDPQGNVLTCGSQDEINSRMFELNPRFNKSLNRALDAYLPQRVRP